MKAKSIREKVAWFNALNEAQKKIFEVEDSTEENKLDLIEALGEKMN